MTPPQETIDFLRVLAGQNNSQFTFSTFTDCKANKRHPDPLAKVLHGRLSEHIATLIEYNHLGAGIFINANKTDLKGRRTENIIRVRTLWQDDDTGHGWHHPDIQPNITVETSPGKYQRYFFTDTDKLDEFDAVQQRLIENHGSDPAAKGIARILRLPGFCHVKDLSNPFLVRIVGEVNPKRNSWEEIKKPFPPVPRPEHTHRQPRSSCNGKNTHQQSGPSGNGEIAEIGKIYAALQYIDADDYATWIEVGMALHNESCGSNEGLLFWDQWSRKSSKYDGYGVCAKKWSTFGKEVTT